MYFAKKQRKIGVFCEQKTKKSKKNSALIFLLIIPQIPNFEKKKQNFKPKIEELSKNSKFWLIFLEFLKINPQKVDYSYEIQEISEKFGKCLKKFKILIKFPFFCFLQNAKKQKFFVFAGHHKSNLTNLA